VSKNAATFLTGLSAQDDQIINQELRKRLLVAKADDSKKYLLLMSVLAVNPSLLTGLDGTTLLRLRTIMELAVESERLTPAAKGEPPGSSARQNSG
jgi:hypothetical protein